jgi:hypothetical protein
MCSRKVSGVSGDCCKPARTFAPVKGSLIRSGRAPTRARRECSQAGAGQFS